MDEITMNRQPRCEWPTNCKEDSIYLVRFWIEEEARFSKEMAFCSQHFQDYQVEKHDPTDRLIKVESSK